MIIKYFSKEQIKINAPRVIHKDLFKKCPISIIQHHISGTEGTAPFHPLFAIVDTPGFQGNAIFFFFFFLHVQKQHILSREAPGAIIWWHSILFPP